MIKAINNFVSFEVTNYIYKCYKMVSVKGRVNIMKTNISTLMNLISEKERNLNNKTFIIKNLAINTSVEELDGRVNIIEDNKIDFDCNLGEIESYISELSKFKAILYEKNNSYKLSDGRTIQQAIVDNMNLRRLKVVLEQLLTLKNSKKRVTEVNNSYFECKTLNFDMNEIRNKLLEMDKKIQDTDFEISKLNSIEFEI